MRILALIAAMFFASGVTFAEPSVPRVHSVSMAAKQPQADDPATIWYDDFDGPQKAYGESSGDLDDKVAFGNTGKSMHCLYEKGSQGKGNRKVFFGDSPIGRPVRKGEVFTDVYWRIYVLHPHGWTGGGPDKMSRATSFASGKWNQAMISHVWGGDGLTLDPASGVRGDRVVTTQYNDFANLHWLGNRPPAPFPMYSPEEMGWWVCVEVRAKLNTPGQADGLNQLWIDGKFQTERKNLDWRGSYAGHGINAVFLEAYWNKGSPVTQSRWYDNFVISTNPIGPVASTPNPTLFKSANAGPEATKAWQVELAADVEGQNIVFRSKERAEAKSLIVSKETGEFLGEVAGAAALSAGKTYWCRARQQDAAGAWSAWSPWHQPFKVVDSR
jgi:hypothetical protein